MAQATESKPEADAADETETAEGFGVVIARDMFGELLNRAGFGGERIVIRRHGKPVAAIVGIADLERLRSLDTASNAA